MIVCELEEQIGAAKLKTWNFAFTCLNHQVVFAESICMYEAFTTWVAVVQVNLNGGPADYAIGTSTTPEGPFKFVHAIDVGEYCESSCISEFHTIFC